MKKNRSIALIGCTALGIVSAWLAKPSAEPTVPPASVTILRDKWGVPHVF